VKTGGTNAPVKRKPTAREVALEVLTRVDKDESYSNLLLNQTLQKSGLERNDAGLATEIVYGTIQRLLTIDYFLAKFVKGGMRKLEPWVRSLLRLSFYQLYYLERVPDHAVVNEAVNIAKKRGHAGISGMVNGVLRSVIRQKDELDVTGIQDEAKRLSIVHSHPEWLIKRWSRQYGMETASRMCAANNEPPRVSVRVNMNKLSRDELLAKLREEGIDAEPSSLAPAGIIVADAGNMANHPGFQRGDFSIQDESSMLVAEILDPQPGMKVLDCCAAPGGKTAHIAEKMGDKGSIAAYDIHEHKRSLIDGQADRLGLRSIRSITGDARELSKLEPPGTFDRILLDAPCSGFGVIRRKPDLKWTKREGDIADIRDIQRSLLSEVSGLLKHGGELVYSTCTMELAENEEMVEAFLADHSDYELVGWTLVMPEAADGRNVVVRPGMLQILPQDYGSDGFFIAKLRRRE
jgi:16S rRNA (cytosine967-C5)-methyltransferase